jgi:secondary thiamine-phosphate synthase enzyme
MKIITENIHLQTRGFTDIVDITFQTQALIDAHNLKAGLATIFIPGSTAGITTIEYEPGLLKDLPEVLEKMIPAGKPYHHDQTWGDKNGYAHLRSALLKTSLTVPFSQGKLTLGTWQQIVLLDFDNRPRSREIVVQLMGE